MTDAEKRAQKAELLLSYQEAVINLEHLRQKASQMARPFRQTSDWLKYIGSSDKKKGPYGEDHSIYGEAIRKNVEDFRKSLDLDVALEVESEIVRTEELVAELKNRKEALGLR